MDISKKKIRKSMKKTQTFFLASFLLLTICSFQSYAHLSYSQSKNFTFHVKDKPIKEVFEYIEKNSEFVFLYYSEVLDKHTKVSVEADNESIQSILDKMFTGKEITYEINGRQISLKEKPATPPLAPDIKQQARKQISGVVKDDTGEVVIGANVVEKGTTNGVVTDANGHFEMTVSENATLQISYIGYTTIELSARNQATFTIVLKEDSQLIGEVVVVGYGTQKKVNLTGAVSQVGGDVLENRPITNIGQGLQGVIPNLNITMSNGGAPGATSSFNIRGTTSLNGGSPLVLVDNVQMDPNLVNPDDIASITVLKDAASSAIYGARAAYGVILITTKGGTKNQRPKISFSANGYWQNPALEMHNVNSMDFLTMKDIAYKNSGGSGSYYNEKLYRMVEAYTNGSYPYTEYYDESLNQNGWEYNANTDWFNELYKTSFSQQYNVGINGGSESTTYYASVGFANQNGILKSTDDMHRKFNANINLTSQITKWLQFSGKIMHTYSTERHPTGSGNSGITNYGGQLKNDLSPLMPIYHSHTGRLFNSPGAAVINQDDIVTTGDKVYVEEGIRRYAGQGSYTNPYAVSELGGNSNFKKNDLWMSGALKITPMEDLEINADYTFNFYNYGAKSAMKKFYDYKAVAGTEQYYPWTNPSYAYYSNNEDYYTALNVFATYRKSLKETHNFAATVGYNQEYKHTKSFNSRRNKLIDDNTPDLNLATGDMTINSAESHWAVNGLFVRLNYNYKERYLFELNGRYDGSSKFGEGDRYAFFPSASAAWRISEESFWEPIEEWWSSMKIRGSYGSLGNQNVSGNFPYLLNYGINSSYGYLLGGSKPVAVSAPGLVSSNLTWETVNQVNLGFDATFLNSRLSTSFDWYRRDTKDMLVAGLALPAVLGANVPNENNADLKTTGWELELSWRDRLSSGFSYWVKGTLSDYIAEITKFENNPNGLISGYYVGRKINEIWGYRSNGLFQSDEEVASAPAQTKLWGGKWAAGDVRYLDLNGDGEIGPAASTLDNPGDRTIIGNSTPRYQFGFTAGFDYYGFDFQMFWQGVAKRDYMLGGAQFWGFTSQWDTPYTPALDYWTTENRNAYFPRPSWQNGGNRQNSDRYLQNAAYIRLKNVTIGYTLPATFLKKNGIDKLRVYVTGENLLTLTPLNDAFDPETLGNLTYPINRKISIGLNVSF